MTACNVCRAELAPGAVACWACGAVTDGAPQAADKERPVAEPAEPTEPASDGAVRSAVDEGPKPPADASPPATVADSPEQPAQNVPPPASAVPVAPRAAAGAGLFRPICLFGIAAILIGCAAILWVILHFATGGGRTAGDAAARASGDARDVLSRADKDVVTGSWGVPWGGASVEPSAGSKVDPDALPSRGAEDPLLALVEFGDYECEFTQKAERTVERVLARFERDVRLVYVHDPLAIHDHAVLAAQAAEAARLQGHFGEMHARLLAAKGQVDRDDVLRLAREIGLDVERFRRDLDGPAKDRIAAMVGFAKARGLTGTPHFVIGGRIIEGARSEEIFARVIEAALADAKAQVGLLHSRADVYRESLDFLSGT
jgi:predicted DsbA family dithiol-disulfide isomerase